jgi:hypothetical protein
VIVVQLQSDDVKACLCDSGSYETWRGKGWIRDLDLVKRTGMNVAADEHDRTWMSRVSIHQPGITRSPDQALLLGSTPCMPPLVAQVVEVGDPEVVVRKEIFENEAVDAGVYVIAGTGAAALSRHRV